MARSQYRSDRKATGGQYRTIYRKKRLYEVGKRSAFTKVEDRRVRVKKTSGNNKKIAVLSTNKANVFDPKTKKYAAANIKNILENPANRHFVRRNIMTKGTVVDTDKGKARITSRPGQDGMVNAVLIS